MRQKLHPRIVRALEDTGLPYDVTHGSRHIQVRLDGRLVLSVSTCRGNGADHPSRVLMNNVAAVRRAARKIKENG